MTINKFQGTTKEEAIEKAKEQMGNDVVIMNVKEIKPKGFFKVFKSSTFEVTASVEEKESSFSQMMDKGTMVKSNIDYKADEKISIPPISKNASGDFDKPVQKKEDTMIRKEKVLSENDKKLEERLDNLSNILEEKLGVPKAEPTEQARSYQGKGHGGEELKFVRILYNTLINNEVNERYINQILEEIERFLRPGNSVDTILSNVYQKLILRFGQPNTIDLSGAKPKVVFFVGPTGVGKTTTIAKIASKYKVDYERKVAFITSDTYSLAASELLMVYANILDAPMSIVYSKEELNAAIEKLSDYDIVFVDTAGFSHKNAAQCEEMKKLIDGVDEVFEKETYLVLSATTKYKDLVDIVNIYNDIAKYKIIFTKLDETTTYGNLLNIKLYSGADLSYTTNGQNVPDDIELFDTQKIVKQLLGGTK